MGKEYAEAREIYSILRSIYPDTDTLDADSIIDAISGVGLYLLKKHKFIEPCACRDGKHLYLI